MVRLEAELGVNTKNAETTTHARAEACADVRNAVSMAAMNALMVPKSDPHLILNVDATQFTVGNAMKKQRVKFRGVPKGPLKATPEEGQTGLTCMFIKFYCTINAAGQVAKPIYILDSPSMPVGEIDVHEVAGLGIGSGLDTSGYVVHMRGRVPGKKFYTWYLREVLVKWVWALRNTFGIAATVPAWFQLDGEAAQIAPYLEDTGIQEMLREHNIVVGKPPASTTEITQALDKGPLFKCSKSRMYTDHGQQISDAGEEEGEEWAQINTKRQKSGILGLIRCHMAVNDTFKPSFIQNSFKLTGIFPLDFGVMLSACTGNVTPEEEVHIVMVALPQLRQLILTQGQLFEKDFNEAGIRAALKNRDDRVVYQRRACILTSTAFLQHEEDLEKAAYLAAEQRIVVAEEKRERGAAKKDIAARRQVHKDAGMTPKAAAERTGNSTTRALRYRSIVLFDGGSAGSWTVRSMWSIALPRLSSVDT
ncbi:hypothetical protein B484DRAFT_437184 [Ochromonadaceae sp. CCMP2298]|nr:hypothetical protein B484DRAFT_437184 [Ochromonadaceae sp. CCMP2298]